MQCVIIGGGLSGMALSVQLAHHPKGDAIGSLHVVEPAASLGLGAAYATPYKSHLLNVRRGNMGLFSEAPGHFEAWLAAQPASPTGDFAPRRTYGRYVQACVADALGAGTWPNRWRHTQARAVDIEPPRGGSPARVHLDDGQSLAADHVALCVGNTGRAPGVLADPALGPRVLAEPWRWSTLEALPSSGTVFIVGTGLTMVDVVLALHERGFTGKIIAMSRRGLRPQAHLEVPGVSHAAPTEMPAHLIELTHRLRQHARAAPPWQSVIDSLRAQTPALWRALCVDDRRRFLRHAKAFWDVHRHRIAPEVNARIVAMTQAKKLTLLAGRLVGIQPDSMGLQITYRGRGAVQPTTVHAACVVNCTGQDADWRRPSMPLLQALLRRKLFRPDPLGLGVCADMHGRVLTEDRSVPSPWLHAVGSALLGRDLEAVAVPELRQQAQQTARAWLDG